MGILKTKDLTFAYQDGDTERVILNQVNVQFETGKFYTILGESGAGKTTFISLIGGLDKIQKGNIYFNGKDINEIGLNEYRRSNVSLIFQNYNLISYMSALENVLLAMSIHEQTRKIDQSKAYFWLNKVGIGKEKALRKVTTLSGGEQQRVAIARSLSCEVDVIMADEPTGNLDSETSQSIVKIFKELAHKENKCVIVVTHSKDIANQSDEILRLDSKIKDFIFE